jgi:hypothetical protein
MTPVWFLAVPIVVAAVLVFLASSIIHMALGYHAADWKTVPQQDAVQEALRRFTLPPGDYMLPRPGSMKEMNSPEFKAKQQAGPVLIMSIWDPKDVGFMGKSLALWFVYTLLVGTFAGYTAGITLGPGAPYMAVFRVTGTVAFAGYALALLQHSIWYRRSWRTTIVSMVDGLIFALLTAGAFGWLWPS